MHVEKDEQIIKEAERQLMICNACRYCEGYCDVWDAIERRRVFPAEEVFHLSNLCHDCRECYYACPYTPPHEFAINIPGILSKVRVLSYRKFVFPSFMERVMPRMKYLYVILTLLIFLSSLIFVSYLHGIQSLYSSYILEENVFPDDFFVIVEYLLYFYLFFMWYMEARKYWREASSGIKFSILAVIRAISDALTHKNFKGGSAGCNFPTEKGSYYRLFSHSFIFYGFIADWLAILFYPFKDPLVSAIFLAGSLLITFGSASTLVMRGIAPRLEEDDGTSFTSMFLAIGISGVTFVLISSNPLWIVFFLLRASLIATLFITAPYSKFMHAVFRFLSLVRDRAEEIETNNHLVK